MTQIDYLKNAFFKIMIAILMVSFYSTTAQTRVNSLRALKPYLNDNNVNVKLAPGTYTVTADDVANGLYDNPTLIGTTEAETLFLFEGNNSTYDFTGVTINIETAVLRAFGNIDFYELQVVGSENVLKNLTMVDIGSVNDAPRKRTTNVVMDGRENRIEGFKLTVKGSNPYGYGDIFGKGGATVIRHQKHSGILVRGESNHLKNTTIIHRAYGHGIFMQAANNALIEGCYVEGELRTTDEVLGERGTAADDVDFMTVWGYKLQRGWTFSLQEDGIRDYNGGATVVDGRIFERPAANTTVKNCTVKHMRSGVTIGLGRGDQRVENVTALGCESGFWVGSNADVIDCKGDASVGPLYSEDVLRNNVSIDLTLLDNVVRKFGNTPSLYLAGSGHNITLKDGTTSFNSEIEILVGGSRLGHRWLAGSGEEPPFRDANGISFNNQTEYPVILGRNSSRNDVISCGKVTDRGSRNDVSTPRGCGTNTPTPPSPGNGRVVHMTKRNATGFAIDGNSGGENGQNIYLWGSNSSTVNQQWNEIDRGNGYYSYQKVGTNFCIDGNGGGANGQNVYLWECGNNNQNQHWRKVSVGGGSFRLEKRNAPGFSLDGGNKGANRQNLYLWKSSNTNQNQHWTFGGANRSNDPIGNNFTASPIPFSNILNIQLEASGLETKIDIMSITGKVVASKVITDSATNTTMDLSHLSNGMYIAKATNSNGSQMVKLLKE